MYIFLCVRFRYLRIDYIDRVTINFHLTWLVLLSIFYHYVCIHEKQSQQNGVGVCVCATYAARTNKRTNERTNAMAMVKGRTIRFGITSLLHFQIKYQCHTTRTIIPLTRDGLASELFYGM